MTKEQIKRLPFVVSAFQTVHPNQSVCGICGLPWSECGTKNIDLDGGIGVFYVCPYCFEHSSLEEVLKATSSGYAKQVNSFYDYFKRADFIKTHDLTDILMKTQEKYLETHKQIEKLKMNKEQIEQAAEEYRMSLPYCDDPKVRGMSIGGYDGFIKGAEWRINSVWHDAKEEPKDKSKFLISYEEKHPVLYTEKINEWEEYAKSSKVKYWAYLDDLLPPK